MKRFLRQARLALGALALAVICSPAFAEQYRDNDTRSEPSGFRFQIVTGDDTEVTRRIAEDLYKRLVPTFAAFRTELAQSRRMLYVTIGPTALRDAVARRCDCVVISAYTSSQVWHAITARLPRNRAMSLTAVYAEPAPADQLRLASLLYGRQPRIAAILSPETAFLRPVLDGEVEIQHFEPGDDINHALNRMTRAEALLAMPDSAVYNTESVRNILLLDLPPQAGRDRLLGRHGQGRRAGQHLFGDRGHQHPGGGNRRRLRDHRRAGAAAVPALLPHRDQRRRGQVARPARDRGRAPVRPSRAGHGAEDGIQ